MGNITSPVGVEKRPIKGFYDSTVGTFHNNDFIENICIGIWHYAQDIQSRFSKRRNQSEVFYKNS